MDTEREMKMARERRSRREDSKKSSRDEDSRQRTRARRRAPDDDDDEEEESRPKKKKKSPFAGISGARVYERGKRFEGGFAGVVIIDSVRIKETRNKGDALIITLEVESTNMKDKHPKGWKGDWYRGLNEKDMAFSNILELVAAVQGYDDPDEIDEHVTPEVQDILDEAIASPEDNDLTGKAVWLETEEITTKNEKEFTVYRFSPLENENENEDGD